MLASTHTAHVVKPYTNAKGKCVNVAQQHRSQRRAKLLPRRLNPEGEEGGDGEPRVAMAGGWVIRRFPEKMVRAQSSLWIKEGVVREGRNPAWIREAALRRQSSLIFSSRMVRTSSWAVRGTRASSRFGYFSSRSRGSLMRRFVAQADDVQGPRIAQEQLHVFSTCCHLHR